MADNIAKVETAIDCNEVFDALEKWINRRPGLDKADYGCAPDQYCSARQFVDASKAYRDECRSIAKDRKRALAALETARGLSPAKPEVLKQAFRAFSGRL